MVGIVVGSWSQLNSGAPWQSARVICGGSLTDTVQSHVTYTCNLRYIS